LIPGEGTYECNGMQAVAYARIRKVGNADYQRTERQREVLMKLLDKVKTMSLEDIDRLANELLPMLTHNIPESEFWGLLAKAPELLGYTIVQDRVPYDGLFQSVNGNLVPEWEETIQRLKSTIYGEDIVDEEGNVITPEPTGETDAVDSTDASGDGTADAAETDGTAADEEPLAESVESQGVLEAQTGSDDGETSQTLREEQAQVILDSLQPEKKAAVVADNVPSKDTAGETEETQEKQEGITNPYVSDVFILHVPDAPQASGEGLINGSYEWELPRYTGEILQTE
ncbi:MAG TPA: LCP family protein, partial [Candidatus Pullilachnospira stercoravium]|nr:LCP family protein [Candidatus Pullilachnospira stercoravium]